MTTVLKHAARTRTHGSTLVGVKRAVIFDGDDTLWLTEGLYDEARAAARAIVEAAGFDGARWEELERALDVSNVAAMGHSPERFPTSCTQALEAVAGHTLDPAVVADVRSAAARVFSLDAPLRPHAKKVVRELGARGLGIALLTKGDRAIQERRIAGSGLAPLFDVIEIVGQKSATDILRILTALGVAPDDALSVGNSIRSDILPSRSAGVDAVWIPAHVWEYERLHDHLVPEGVATITDLDELLELLDP